MPDAAPHPRHQYRVTKYDPALRNEAGFYTKDEWTAISDIGRSYDGVVLTEEAYLKTESAYLEVVLSFHAEAGFPELRAQGVECREGVMAPDEGAVVSREELSAVCRAVLRETYWCRLVGDGFFIHFGYDYYMYAGAQSECRESVALAQGLGLFVEPFVSPYHPEEDDEAS